MPPVIPILMHFLFKDVFDGRRNNLQVSYIRIGAYCRNWAIAYAIVDRAIISEDAYILLLNAIVILKIDVELHLTCAGNVRRI